MNGTPRFNRRTLVNAATGMALAGLLLGGVAAPAANAVEYTGPVRGITTPQQAATEQYARDVATEILIGNAHLGRPLPTASSYVNQSDPDVVNLVAAHKAKAYNTSGGIRRDADGIMYGTISYQSGLLIVNPTNKWIQHVNEYTGGTYVLPPTSGHFEWVPKGSIGVKWKALGGASKAGLPTSAERSGVAGVHVGATSYVSQSYITTTGATSEFYWTSKYKRTHQVKGAIYRNWQSAGGARTQGVPISDEIKNADGSVTQRFERVTITWKPGGAIVRK